MTLGITKYAACSFIFILAKVTTILKSIIKELTTIFFTKTCSAKWHICTATIRVGEDGTFILTMARIKITANSLVRIAKKIVVICAGSGARIPTLIIFI
jgi:hypothetical protein